MTPVAVHAFPGPARQAQALAEALDAPFAQVELHRFPDGEILPTVPAPSQTVIVYASLDQPNEKLIALCLAAEAWRRLGVRRLVLVAPYLAYMRQDAAFAPGQAISQRAVGGLLSERFDRLVTVDAHLHRTRELGAVVPGIEAENLDAAPLIGDWLAARGVDPRTMILGPDEESAPLVQAMAGRLGLGWRCFSKTRLGDREVRLALAGADDLKGRPVVIVDDIVSTGRTLIAAIGKAREHGASTARVALVHALFDQSVLQAMVAAGADEVVSTDSVPHPTNAIPLAALLAAALASELPR